MNAIAGIVLAGGASSRMGREKAFVPLAGRPVLAHVLKRLRSQVSIEAISANGDPARFADFGCPVIADKTDTTGHGPLAGILAGLNFAESQGCAGITVVPSDAPFLPLDLVTRLAHQLGDLDVALAESAAGLEPLFSIWPIAARPSLINALAQGNFSVIRLIEGMRHGRVRFAATQPDPFFNLNCAHDIEIAERWLASR